VKTAPLAQWEVSRELRARIKRAFDERGFEIPYRQHTVWLRSEDKTSGSRPAAKKKATARR
jgi:small conductance mechanosensitive channel